MHHHLSFWVSQILFLPRLCIIGPTLSRYVIHRRLRAVSVFLATVLRYGMFIVQILHFSSFYQNLILGYFFLVAAHKHKLKKGTNIKMLDSKPGVYTQYQPFLQKDKVILKKLTKGIENKRPDEVQSALLRRHLLELTQSFMIPLERYMASLMPLHKNISPYKVSRLWVLLFNDF